MKNAISVSLEELLQAIYFDENAWRQYSTEFIAESLLKFIVFSKRGSIGTRKDLLKQKNHDNTSYGVWIINEPANESGEGSKLSSQTLQQITSIVNSQYFKANCKRDKIFDKLGQNIRVFNKIEAKENLIVKKEPKVELQLFPKQLPGSQQTFNINLIESFFKREKNEPLYKLYNIIISNGEDGITYSKISKAFTKAYGKKIKMDHQIVAHYCKKLEKQGFIIWTTLQKNSERKVYPREEYFSKFFKIISTFYSSIHFLDKFPYK